MAITIDYATKVISVPQADLTLVSGTLYTLDSDQFRKDVNDLLAAENHIWMPDAYTHNTQVTVAGITYARTIEFINGYSITFENTGSAYTVRIEGSNNNIFDVENGILNPTSLVTVVPTNSAGLQVVSTGSGLSASQDQKLTDIDNKTDTIEGHTLDMWRTLGLEVGNKVTITPTGLADDNGNIVVSFSGDGVTQTVMERTT